MAGGSLMTAAGSGNLGRTDVGAIALANTLSLATIVTLVAITVVGVVYAT